MSIPFLPGETPGAYLARVLDSQEFADAWRVAFAARDGTLRSLTAAGPAELAGPLALLATMVVGGVYGLFVWPYASAEEDYRSREMQTGFSQGLVAALIGWEWRHVSDRFLRQYLRINEFDDQMNQIRVTAYNVGLALGFKMGKAFSPDVASAVLRAIRKAANEQAPATWNRQTQISYVIALGAAAVRGGFVPQFRNIG
jgi:hypothetical protein